jgi:hypothetical protein
VDRAMEREHQAAVRDGLPWPPERKPEPGREAPEAAPGREPQPAQPRPGTPEASAKPELLASERGIPESEAGVVPSDAGYADRLDELQARADKAARRIDVRRAELDASSQHTARIEREAQAEQGAGRQAETRYEMEL